MARALYAAGVACNYVLYAILAGGNYCICNNVPGDFAYAIMSFRTLLNNAIVSARTHLHNAVVSARAFFLQAKCFLVMNYMGYFRPLGIRCNRKIRHIHAAYPVSSPTINRQQIQIYSSLAKICLICC